MKYTNIDLRIVEQPMGAMVGYYIGVDSGGGVFFPHSPVFVDKEYLLAYLDNLNDARNKDLVKVPICNSQNTSL